MPENGEKIRLDLIVSKKLGTSRTIAADLIKSGDVSVNGKKIYAPGAKLSEDERIIIQKPDNLYVSRGGYKLEKALSEFSIDIEDKICADVGASTGGFTQCMLNAKAKKVYAIDSGTDQLAESIRFNEKVVSLEKTDVRAVVLPETVDFISVDVSFISVIKIVSSLCSMLSEYGQMVILIKPQFEAGIGYVSKKGVIKDKKIYVKILKNVYNSIISHNLIVLGLILSPIKGQDGNTEFLMYLKKSGDKRMGLDMNKYVSVCEALIKEA